MITTKTDYLTRPPKTWKNTDTHYINALEEKWYKYLLVIQDEINHSTFNFFRKKGLRSVCLPVTTGSVTSPMGLGSDSLPVKINLEGIDTYLSDSMQFHLEYALRYSEQGVHYIMPSFRGEQADERHLCQFYHSEAEIIGTLEDVLTLVNEYVHSLSYDILNNIPDIIRETAGDTKHIEHLLSLDKKYPRITLKEAINLLGDSEEYFSTHSAGFKTITNKGEQELIKYFNGIVWLTHHDYMSVPFYQSSNQNGEALNGDLLFGIGEVVGSGERHKSAKELREALHIHQVNEKDYEWYVKMKEITPLKTSGFGMGIERFILWLTRQTDIRDTQLIPRFNSVLINP